MLDESFFGLFRRSFNDRGWIGDKSWLEWLNENFNSATHETANGNKGINPYSLKFYTLIETMKDCICEAKGFIEGIKDAMWGDDSTSHFEYIDQKLGTINTTISNLELNPTINNNVTVDACCEDTAQAINNIGDTITNLGDTITNTINNINNSINHVGDIIQNDNSTTITIDNGDGTYTTTCEPGDEPPFVDAPINPPSYPPIDPTDPQGQTTAPYKPVTVTPSNRHNALCGFTYYYLTQFADMVEWLISWLDPFAYLYSLMSSYNATKQVLSTLDAVAPSGLVIAKIPVSKATSLVSGYFLLQQGIELIPMYIRDLAEEFACGINGKEPISTSNQFISAVRACLPIGTPNEAVNWAGFAAGLFWDYFGADDSTNMVINMNSYAQYCPCPLSGLFNGTFWNGITGNGEKWLYLESDEIGLWGTHTSINLFGTLYESEIVDGLIDPNNELSASGTLHVISHTGFPDTGFNMSTNTEGTQIYFGTPSQTYTRQ